MKSLVLLLFLVEVLSCCHARDRLFTMRFTREILAPDGVNASVITINNIFPGPTLRVNIGDRLVVNVSNYLGTGEMLSLHWHGISQRGSPWNDGAAAVTNCAISYGREHTYSFITEESGTFWYHLHNGVERGEGGYGFLIVEEPEVVASYDEERLLVLADWFRVSSDEINSRLNAFGQRGAQYWPGSGDSLLVNGKGQQHVFVDVQPNKMYRFRVLNAGSLAYLNLAIAAHDLTIITSGSTLIRPVSMKSLDVAVAQRFDFLLHTDQQPLSYNIRIYSQYQVRNKINMHSSYKFE